MIRGNRYPNLQVVITHASHVGCHHFFGLPVRLNEMHRMQFDHMRLDILLLCNLITLVFTISHVKLMQSTPSTVMELNFFGL